MILETTRLIIRPIRPEDKNEIFKYRSDKEVNKYQGWIPRTLEDVEIFIDKVAKHINEPGSWFQFVIIEKESQKIIGDLGLHFLDSENKQVEIGCTLDIDFHNKGYATESLRRVIEYVFRELGKHRITTSIDPDNTNSIRLMERLGFRKEAHFVESLFVNGKWTDDLVYALLAREWKF
ncbi:MAG: GNAT family N-acetyltransferase [Prevotella sp.]|jgi:RimJ/RimL family protein N-acetyltransferase|nr:GNAT family N-acetyltransferase [Prevotella sp.]